MCSTDATAAAARVAEIGRAIDDLAVKAGPDARAGAAADDTDPILARLAELWALLAELDPEVAKRLAGYQSLSALTDLWLADYMAPRSRAGQLTDGWDWPSSRRWRAVPAATLRRDGPPTFSCR